MNIVLSIIILVAIWTSIGIWCAKSNKRIKAVSQPVKPARARVKRFPAELERKLSLDMELVQELEPAI
jgi:hypothetical protein